MLYMIAEHRLQIYLPKAFYGKLRRRAAQEGKSLAQIVRESLEQYFNRSRAEQVRDSYATIDAMVGTLRDDGSGAAETHDEHLGSSGRW